MATALQVNTGDTSADGNVLPQTDPITKAVVLTGLHHADICRYDPKAIAPEATDQSATSPISRL